MRKFYITFIVVLILAGCVCSDEKTLLTQIPVTQTAEWQKILDDQERAKQLNCFYSIRHDSYLLSEASLSCTSGYCKDGIADKIEKLSVDLKNICPMVNSCTSAIYDALQTYIDAVASYVRGPGVDLNPFEEDMALGILHERVMLTNELLDDKISSSCLLEKSTYISDWAEFNE